MENEIQICLQCGSVADEGDNFCTQCGARLELELATESFWMNDKGSYNREETMVLSDLMPTATKEGSLYNVFAGETVRLNRSPFKLGKNAGLVDYQIKDNSTVSRYHATIYYREGCYFLEDHSSKNGTFVNGERIDSEVELQDGDEVRLSDEEFIFKLG